jgi:hypothetical protein
MALPTATSGGRSCEKRATTTPWPSRRCARIDRQTSNACSAGAAVLSVLLCVRGVSGQVRTACHSASLFPARSLWSRCVLLVERCVSRWMEMLLVSTSHPYPFWCIQHKHCARAWTQRHKTCELCQANPSFTNTYHSIAHSHTHSQAHSLTHCRRCRTDRVLACHERQSRLVEWMAVVPGRLHSYKWCARPSTNAATRAVTCVAFRGLSTLSRIVFVQPCLFCITHSVVA